jgi:signal transduction histidine kinase
MHVRGTPQCHPAATICDVGAIWQVRRARWEHAARQIALAPSAPAVTAALLALAGAVQASTQAASISGLHYGGPISNTELALVLLSLITTLPAGAVRSFPVTAAITVTVANLMSFWVLHALTVAGVAAQLILVYALGRAGAQLLSAALAVPFLLLSLSGGFHITAPGARPLAILLASLGPLLGWAGGARRAHLTALEHSETQEDIAGALLEHTARGERVRISRELHDVVAHHISMIAVQAETARLTTPGLPDSGAQRLSAIGDTARTALTEMRRLLGVLREDTGGTPVADRHPQPGLAQLNELIDEARDVSEAGARLIISGWPAPLDPGVEVAAYRIIQEALTNARRHAPGAAVDVELHFADDALLVRVRDNGPGPGGGSLAGAAHAGGGMAGGNGLLGMRERAAAVGGSLRTGPADIGGFLVEARLPSKAGVEAAQEPERAAVS